MVGYIYWKAYLNAVLLQEYSINYCIGMCCCVVVLSPWWWCSNGGAGDEEGEGEGEGEMCGLECKYIPSSSQPIR